VEAYFCDTAATFPAKKNPSTARLAISGRGLLEKYDNTAKPAETGSSMMVQVGRGERATAPAGRETGFPQSQQCEEFFAMKL
jgi:hypothetical protein